MFASHDGSRLAMLADAAYLTRANESGSDPGALDGSRAVRGAYVKRRAPAKQKSRKKQKTRRPMMHHLAVMNIVLSSFQGAKRKTVQKKPKDMPVVRKKFEEWFDECIEPDETDATHSEPERCWLQKNSALQHYKSWCKAKGLPEAHRLSDRCSMTCKANKCPVDSCSRFLVHMCDALGYERYVTKDRLDVREAFKAGQGKEAKYCYKAYFKNGKTKDVTNFKGSTIALVQTAKYKE